MALVRFELNTEHIRTRVNANRAWLISNALVTALLIMAGSYLVIRHVIVKPVKHLKSVADAIYAGQLDVRSEIATGVSSSERRKELVTESFDRRRPRRSTS